MRDRNAWYLGTPRQEVKTAYSGLPEILIQKVHLRSPVWMKLRGHGNKQPSQRDNAFKEKKL